MYTAVWIFWKPGNPDFWKSGNPDFGDLEIQKVGVQKMKKIKILKIQIHSAQNVGKAWISRKKSSRPYLGPSEAIFSMDQKNPKNVKKIAYFSLSFLVCHWLVKQGSGWSAHKKKGVPTPIAFSCVLSSTSLESWRLFKNKDVYSWQGVSTSFYHAWT